MPMREEQAVRAVRAFAPAMECRRQPAGVEREMAHGNSYGSRLRDKGPHVQTATAQTRTSVTKAAPTNENCLFHAQPLVSLTRRRSTVSRQGIRQLSYST